VAFPERKVQSNQPRKRSKEDLGIVSLGRGGIGKSTHHVSIGCGCSRQGSVASKVPGIGVFRRRLKTTEKDPLDILKDQMKASLKKRQKENSSNSPSGKQKKLQKKGVSTAGNSETVREKEH